MTNIYDLILSEISAGELYTSDREGNDEAGDGSQAKPFKSILQVVLHSFI